MIEERNYPLIIAHRGASASAPENTITAFKKAVDEGAEGIEFDVRLAKDGIPVVFHDPDLKRICGIDGNLEDFSSQDLGKFDSGSWFNKNQPSQADRRFSTETIPTLDASLDALREFDGILYVELKSEGEDISALTHSVCDILTSSSINSRIIVKSFELSAIALVRNEFPHLATASLFEPTVKTVFRKEEEIVRASERVGAHRISLHFSLATRKLMKLAKEVNLPVTIWTTDHPRWIKRGIDLGIEHIITNDPARMLAQREKFLNQT